jgi:ribosomal protein S12 methylthiotransferase accessory factor
MTSASDLVAPHLSPPGETDHPLVGRAGRLGAVGPVRLVKTDGWMPSTCAIYSAIVGQTPATENDPHGSTVSGTGRAYADPARARLLAVAEALERQADGTIDEDLLTNASAAELGDEAMDLDLVARCSQRELRRPGCPVRMADKNAAIRWAKAVDLHSGADKLVPAIMVSLGLSRQPAERFWLPISTGAAAHVTLEAAVINAICELIERDALALTWLQCLPLPRLADDCIPEQAREVIDWYDRNGVETRLFDATTDVGVPTIYCVQTAREASVNRAAQLVGAATDFDVPAAVVRAIFEAAGMRIHSYYNRVPRSYRDYTGVCDSAVAMGRRSRRHAFGFLLDERPDDRVARPRSRTFGSESELLAFLLRRLRELQMSVYAVDVSIRELDEAGLVGVHLVIPELQPMSLRPLAQYRAHPRLYRAPERMGMPVRPESRLNPCPQPMA